MASSRMPVVTVAAALMIAGCDLHSFVSGLREADVSAAGGMPVVLPYREGKGGVVILTGRVNGRTDVDFILDTGAPVTVLIDGSKTAALQLDTTGARPLGDPNDPATPVGVIQQGFALTFGDVSLTGVSAVVLSEKSMPCPERIEEVGFSGVIGADLFRRFVVEVNPAARRVTLHDPSIWRLPAGATAVPLAFHHGHAFVDAKVTLDSGEQIALPLHVDTGMARSLALVAGNPPAVEMPVTGEVRKGCYVGGLREARIGPPVTVSLAAMRFPVESPEYSARGTRPAVQDGGAIGSGVLSTQRYAVDYRGNRLVFLPADRA
jgi:hypothetical protein